MGLFPSAFETPLSDSPFSPQRNEDQSQSDGSDCAPGVYGRSPWYSCRNNPVNCRYLAGYGYHLPPDCTGYPDSHGYTDSAPGGQLPGHTPLPAGHREPYLYIQAEK